MSSSASEPVFGATPLTVRRHPRARRMRLAVDPRDGAVILSLPRRASLAKGMAWAESQRAWVESALAKLPASRPLEPGGAMPWEGVDRLIDWSPAHPRAPRLVGGRIELGGPRDAVASRLIAWGRREALRVLDAETRTLATKHGIAVSRIGVGDPRSRWGSCSASGDIRYSWRLMMAPAFVRHATIAHELAHRIHMNHSPAFHALAADLTGFDPARSRAWLRAHGAALHMIGR